MERIAVFWQFVQQYHWNKRWMKLSSKEQDIVRLFLNDNVGLSKADFEYKVNRMFLDKADKPKNWTLITEILVNVNSHVSA